MNSIKFTRVSSNADGQPRYVCHFLNLNTKQEKSFEFAQKHGLKTVSIMYNLALARSRDIGGRKFHNKQYGGGIAFTCSARDTDELERQIEALVRQAEQKETES